MRILVLTGCYPPSRGGVERCAFELTKRFASRGYTVQVSTQLRVPGALPTEVTSEGVEVFRSPVKSYILEAPRGFGAAFRVLWTDFDVLHAHGMTPGVTDFGVFFAKLRRKPVVLTYHNDAETPEGGTWGIIANSFYSIISSLVVGVSDVLVSSSYSYASTSPSLQPFKDRITVIPMGVDFNRFQTPYSEQNNGKTAKRLLFVGQLKKYKGVDTLLEAVKIISSEHRNEITLTVVGDGPEMDMLRAKARALELDRIVKFTGTVSDEALNQYYTSSDLLVLPSKSRREAFGIVLLEAMSAGIPVVASDIPGVREVVKSGGGLLAQPGNPKSFADAILKMISNEKNYREIAAYSRKAAKSYDWDVITDMYEDVFKKLAPDSNVKRVSKDVQIAYSRVRLLIQRIT